MLLLTWSCATSICRQGSSRYLCTLCCIRGTESQSFFLFFFHYSDVDELAIILSKKKAKFGYEQVKKVMHPSHFQG
jgi:hypothetical protein